MKARYFIVILLLVIVLSGCNSDANENDNGHCNVFNCVEMIDLDNSVAEINDLTGVYGTLIDVDYDEYYWELTSDYGVYVDYVNGVVKAHFTNDLIANKDVDFTRYDEISYFFDEELLTYDDVVEMLGDVSGVCIEKGKDYVIYAWVDENGEYLNATFTQDYECIRIVASF